MKKKLMFKRNAKKRMTSKHEVLVRDRFNILITSISKKVPLIKAVKGASSRLANSGVIYGADLEEQCAGRYFVDVFWKMPRIEKLEIYRFIEYCLKNNISCIIPTRDGELPFFSKHKEILREHDIAVMSSDYSSVQVCLDKLAFLRWLIS